MINHNANPQVPGMLNANPLALNQVGNNPSQVGTTGSPMPGLFGVPQQPQNPQMNPQLASMQQTQQQQVPSETLQIQKAMLKYISTDAGQSLVKKMSGQFPIFEGLIMSPKVQNQIQDTMENKPINPASESMYNAGLASTPMSGGQPVNSPAQVQYQSQSSPLGGFQAPQ
jgi:hypothetical protein